MTDNHNNTMAEESAATQAKPNKNRGEKRATAAIILAVLLTGSVIAFEAYQYTQSQQTIRIN